VRTSARLGNELRKSRWERSFRGRASITESQRLRQAT
jgi:hypothetical protein